MWDALTETALFVQSAVGYKSADGCAIHRSTVPGVDVESTRPTARELGGHSTWQRIRTMTHRAAARSRTPIPNRWRQ